MILEDFIRYIEDQKDQILMSYGFPVGGIEMEQSVLIYQPVGSDDFVAVQWPQQRYQASGTTRELAMDNFVSVWNARNNPDRTADFFRFFGPLLLTAYVKSEPEGWVCVAYAETVYQSEYHDTEEAAKEDFISVWNAAHPDLDPVEDVNIDWQRD